ncbi:hypothetical protein R1T40_08645 [Tritonibacter scottomollicae]|uniref:Uncharacterized protein n=1 Tax=Tritonibacter scottomollicae TaxID=483013 RepID=A0ABZ0HL68_TRISK|nr:hypothetical protein [Tritonibacter scottomollicae]WOI34779.1 hypothetical protein R1T40_08645 [Tritonibacter scottomollicae]
MATSTEQINALIAGYTDLKAYFEGARDDLNTAKNNLPALLRQVVYVDEANGLPGNSGSSAEPFATIDDAISAFKDGQAVEIRLLTNATFGKRHWRYGMQIRLAGYDLGAGTFVNRSVTLAGAAVNQVTSVPGINMSGSGMVSFLNVDLSLSQAVLDGQHFVSSGFLAMSFDGCAIDGGAAGDSALLHQYAGAFALGIRSTTFSNMDGRWVYGFAAGAPLTADACGGIIDPAITN